MDYSQQEQSEYDWFMVKWNELCQKANELGRDFNNLSPENQNKVRVAVLNELEAAGQLYALKCLFQFGQRQ